MTDDAHDLYDVAIVGLGPSGVVAAALLGQAGLRVYACDRLADVHEIPRAMAIDHEIMRVFQQIGVDGAVLPFTEPFTNSEYIGVDGQVIRRMTMIDPPFPQGHTPSIVFTQPDVERVLRRRVAEMDNVSVNLGVELRHIEQDDNEVRLQVQSSDGVGGRVRARYAIGCDGGGSLVRAQMGVALDDLDFDEPWLVVDLRVNEQGLAKLPAVSVQFCEPERPCTLVIGPKNHRRFEISLKDGETPQDVAMPEATWQLLSRWLTPDDAEIWRQACYRFHALVASQWRKGRVFLAGDAAHMQPPFLGQGMCQGVRDVANLTWKMIAALRDDMNPQAREALLDSYGIERGAHVRELTERIKQIGADICERDIDKARARDARLLAQQGGTVADTPRQDIIPRLRAGLLSSREQPGRGELMPQPAVNADGRRTLIDQLTGHGWRLFLLESRHQVVLSEWIRRVRDFHVVSLEDIEECDGVLADWFARKGCRAALVRPDNYVYGVAGSSDDVRALLDEAVRALGTDELTAQT